MSQFFDSFFLYEQPPLAAIETGVYQLPLVVLSYLVASFASYTALSMMQQLIVARGGRDRRLFHFGGAFAMGAGIWSMHFIGMLSYKMDMVVSYDPFITFLSMIIAITVAYGALQILAHERPTFRRLGLGAALLGFGICAMHYTGMAAMRMDGDLRYVPWIFFLSFFIAAAAAWMALWVALFLPRPAPRFSEMSHIGSALAMGAAICGMHYTGMASAVFLPYADCRYDSNQDFDALALSIAAIASIILACALFLGIYKRRRMEEDLRDSELRLRLIFESALDAIISINEKGMITEWSCQAESVFGWTRDEAVGQPLASLIIPENHRRAHQKGLERFLKEGEGPIMNRRVELSALRKGGSEFPVELTVTAQLLRGVYHFTAFCRDVTERKEHEKTQSLLAAIVRSSDDAIISKSLEGAILSWNVGAKKMFGYTQEEVVGKNIRLIIPPDRMGEEMHILKQMRAGIPLEHFETSRVTQSGQVIDISATISPVYDLAGDFVAISIVARDITERKKTEQKIKDYTRDLERSNQELEDFAHIASHDLKEPLRGLTNLATFLMEDYNDKLDAQGVKWLKRTIELCGRMEALISDLLYFSRLSGLALATQKTDLNAVVDDIIDMLEPVLKERNAVIETPKSLPSVTCDKPRVTELLRNLVTNAIKYNDKPHPYVEIGFIEKMSTRHGEERNVFYVKDNGIGIAPKFHEKVFRIFKRLDTPYGKKDSGTGVGLTFVKKIVERHQGRIWIESEPDNGSTFFFTLNR